MGFGRAVHDHHCYDRLVTIAFTTFPSLRHSGVDLHMILVWREVRVKVVVKLWLLHVLMCISLQRECHSQQSTLLWSAVCI